MDLKELEGWEGDLQKHWYYASKAAALDRILQRVSFRSIADIGAGSGFFSKHLLVHRSDAATATCVDINYENENDERVAQKLVSYRKRADALHADLYLLMDVMEHVKDDKDFLKTLVDSAPVGAHFLITVPAFNFLWSVHDVFLGHYRRYTLREITNVVRAAGLTVETRCYYFGSVFPAVAAMRISRNVISKANSAPSSDMRNFSNIANKTLRAVCRLEENVFTLNRAFGLTAFVLAKRGI